MQIVELELGYDIKKLGFMKSEGFFWSCFYEKRQNVRQYSVKEV